jgi:hypothetical protein
MKAHIEWLRDCMDGGYHQALSRYLVRRSRDQAEEADRLGLTVNDILLAGFRVENGHTSVPDAAMRVMRVPGVDVRLIMRICLSSDDKRVVKLFSKRLRHRVRVGDLPDDEITRSVLDELCVHEVMES